MRPGMSRLTEVAEIHQFSPSSYLRKMIVLTDDFAVFRLLEEAGRASFSASAPAVFSFEHGPHFCLLIFVPSGTQKGCRLFLLEKQLLDQEIQNGLLPGLLALPDDAELVVLKNKALSIAEEIISARSSSRLFYDAH